MVNFSAVWNGKPLICDISDEEDDEEDAWDDMLGAGEDGSRACIIISREVNFFLKPSSTESYENINLKNVSTLTL